MSNNASVNAELVIRIKDGTPQGAAAVVKSAEAMAQKSSTAIERAAKKSADDVDRSNKQQRTSYEKLSQAREALGVRSEKTIQKEIETTRRAYGQLASAGFASAQEQERAYAAVQSRITRLTNEMGKLTVAQRKAADEAKRLAQIEADQVRGQKVVRGVVAGVVGTGAAAYTLRDPAKNAMSFDRRLAGMANTAYAERDAAGRIVGMKELESGINKARRYGGGTREQAAEALDTMIASGTVSDSDAIKMLPGIMKTSTASGADASALATIAIRAKQSMKIGADDLPKVLSAALAAGQAGGFELKDMAKWLPQQMAMAGNLGLSGREGFAKLAAWNQGSVITAGTKDEAGNNLRDLLNELNTPHFRKYIADQYLANGQKAGKGEKEKRLKGIDEVFLDYQNRGVDKVSATVDIMEKVFSKNKTYQGLQTKLKALSPDDKDGRREIIEAMTAQVQGTDVGKVFHNQQSLMAFISLMNNQDYVNGVLGKARREFGTDESKNEVAKGYEVNSSTSSYKLEQAGEDKEMAQKSAMDSLTPAIGKAAEAFSDLASKHPLLIGTTTLATTALAALAGAAGVTAIAMGGKLPGGGAISRVAETISGSSIGRFALRGGAALAPFAALYGASEWAGDTSNDKGRVDTALGLSGLISNVLAAIGLDKEKDIERRRAEMRAELEVTVRDDRVSVSSTKLEGTNVKAYMNTGNVMTGAP